MSATIASIVALESGNKCAVLPTDRVEPADRAAQLKRDADNARILRLRVRHVPSSVARERRHALENCVQPLHAATADVHLAQEQIGEHAQQREHANDHHPCDSGSGVAMGPKQDPRDHRQLEQCDECNSEQRVMERGDHA